MPGAKHKIWDDSGETVFETYYPEEELDEDKDKDKGKDDEDKNDEKGGGCGGAVMADMKE